MLLRNVWAELECQALAAIKGLEEQRLTLTVLVREDAQHFAEEIEPPPGEVEDQLTAADAEAMDSLVALSLESGAKLLEWSTLTEFDDLMTDVERPLHLCLDADV